MRVLTDVIKHILVLSTADKSCIKCRLLSLRRLATQTRLVCLSRESADVLPSVAHERSRPHKVYPAEFVFRPLTA